MRIAIAGGTGTVGREVAREADRRGHDTVILSRASGVDLVGGHGVDAALAGADTVIDVVSTPTMSARVSTEFFRAASGNLLARAEAVGVPHGILLSIVGIDRNPHGYYAGKVAQERLYAEAALPTALLRATQFHEFAGQVAAQAALGPVQLAPRARVQPVAAATVAARLLDLAEAGATGRATDLAGPREEELSDLVTRWVRHTGRRGPVIPFPVPNAQMRGMRQGLALPDDGADLCGPTFTEWLSPLG